MYFSHFQTALFRLQTVTIEDKITPIWVNCYGVIREDVRLFFIPIDAVSEVDWDFKGMECFTSDNMEKAKKSFTTPSIYIEDEKLTIYKPDGYWGDFDKHTEVSSISFEEWKQLDCKEQSFYLIVAVLGKSRRNETTHLNQNQVGNRESIDFAHYTRDHWFEYDVPSNANFKNFFNLETSCRS